MEFEYTGYLYINSRDLRQMYLRVKKGEDFSNVYYDIMGGYDDCDYYCCEYVFDQVKAEIERRLSQNKGV